MRVAHSIAEFAEIRDGLAAEHPATTVALVPTMGALHDGHRSLFRIARNVADLVIVSIFVNPLQFGPEEDYARYPRVLDEDLDACRQEEIDLVFVPSVTELYPTGRQVSVSAGPLGSIVEGVSRAGHFDGMLTVIAKLFNIVRPDKAIFGAKDAQQLACVRRMATDLNFDIDIVAGPVVRESDGLAMSSRNRFLLPRERASAVALSAALRAAARQDTPQEAVEAARDVVRHAEENPAFQLDYLTLVNPVTFAELTEDVEGDALLLVAATVGQTWLTDNMQLTFTTSEPVVDGARLVASGVASQVLPF